MEKIKLNEEQIKKLDEFKQMNQALSFEIGQITRQKWSIEAALDDLKKSLENTGKEEKEFMDELQKEYGNGSLSLETYEFTPQEGSNEEVSK